MPTYDFRCKDCGHRFEVTRPITENGTPACTNCGQSEHVVKVFPKVGISFKGSGFYKTDSRGSSKSTAEGKGDKSSDGAGSSEKAAASSSGSSSGTGSDVSSSSSSSASPSSGSGSGSSGSGAAAKAS